MLEFTHLELDREIEAPAGYYTPKKEIRLKYDGREILYIINQTVVDSACCGVANFSFALVPGFIVDWKVKKNNAGGQVSLVEPITDKNIQDDIRKIIGETEDTSLVDFW